MRNEETEIRIEAMRRLDMVATALGPVPTVEKLVPFLIGESFSSEPSRVNRGKQGPKHEYSCKVSKIPACAPRGLLDAGAVARFIFSISRSAWLWFFFGACFPKLGFGRALALPIDLSGI
jgi:hypothetical protein